MRHNYTVVGSGAEDIGGMRMTQESVSRQENNLHRQAEDKHRMRRLDRDRLIASALHSMMVSAIMKHGDTSPERHMFVAANLHGASDSLMTSAEMENYVRDLMADIRAQLSPIATGRVTV